MVPSSAAPAAPRPIAARVLEPMPPTLARSRRRWCRGGSPHPKEQLFIPDVEYVDDRLADLCTPEEARIKLYAKHPLLDGARAIDLIHDDATNRALAAIESLSDGVRT